MNYVEIWHNKAERQHGEPDLLGRPMLEFAYKYTPDAAAPDVWGPDHSANPQSYLELVFRYNNAVTGDPAYERNVFFQTRSLSVGDVAQLPDGSTWAVASMGWNLVSRTDFLADVARGSEVSA